MKSPPPRRPPTTESVRSIRWRKTTADARTTHARSSPACSFIPVAGRLASVAAAAFFKQMNSRTNFYEAGNWGTTSGRVFASPSPKPRKERSAINCGYYRFVFVPPRPVSLSLLSSGATTQTSYTSMPLCRLPFPLLTSAPMMD